jgi:hypothetical protein
MYLHVCGEYLHSDLTRSLEDIVSLELEPVFHHRIKSKILGGSVRDNGGQVRVKQPFFRGFLHESMYPSRDKPRRNITWVGRVLKLRSKGGQWWEFLQELGEAQGGVHVVIAGWLIRLWFGEGVEVPFVGVS